MNTNCEIIRDILPLYADDVCSDESRSLVDEHLRQCAACQAYLEQIRSSEAESDLRNERSVVIRNQARRFRRRSATIGSVIAALLMAPVLICLIVNLTSARTLDWFFVVVAGMAVAASLTVVPLTVPGDKLFWTFCAFCVSLELLLAVCCLYTRGAWFPVASSASLFGLSVVFLPFAIRAKPIARWVEGRNKALLVLIVDFILFANMMNMISLGAKSTALSILMAALVVVALGLLAAEVILKWRAKR